jgi:hypothetical protein
VLPQLDDPIYAGRDPSLVDRALERLGVVVPEGFAAFWRRYEGGFSSAETGYELLDLCAGTPSVVSQTEDCREVRGFPQHILVLSDLLGLAALMYDVRTDQVFNVDFEGGDQLIIRGELDPEWDTFDDFLHYYFGGRLAHG